MFGTRIRSHRMGAPALNVGLTAVVTALLSSLAGGLRAAEPAAAPASPVVRFLTRVKAAEAIVAEKVEPYFQLLTPLEMAVKTGRALDSENPGAARAQCKRRYADAVRDFTDAEKKAVTRCLERLHPVLVRHYPLLARTPWSLIKKAPTLEGGAHFTRERQIVLSAQYLSRAAQLLTGDKDNGADQGADNDARLIATLGRLLLHEQTHVLQRLHPKLFARLYTEVWGFKHAAKVKSCPWLDARQVVNPDAVDVGWVYPLKDGDATRWLWPRIILTKTDGVPVMFRDMRMVLIDVTPTDAGFAVRLNDDGSPVRQPMQQVSGYVRRFRHGGAFHPNEAAAGALPAIILADLANRDDPKATPRAVNNAAADQSIRKWFAANLK